MQDQIKMDNSTTRQQLRGVVVTVVAAKLAVFALLMTTVNLPAPAPSGLSGTMEISALR